MTTEGRSTLLYVPMEGEKPGDCIDHELGKSLPGEPAPEPGSGVGLCREMASAEDGQSILKLTPAEAKKLIELLRSPSGHCDWCGSYRGCPDGCMVPRIELAEKRGNLEARGIRVTDSPAEMLGGGSRRLTIIHTEESGQANSHVDYAPDEEPSFEDIRQIIGGELALCTLPDGRTMLMDGERRQLPPNAKASVIAQKPIVGPVVILDPALAPTSFRR